MKKQWMYGLLLLSLMAPCLAGENEFLFQTTREFDFENSFDQFDRFIDEELGGLAGEDKRLLHILVENAREAFLEGFPLEIVGKLLDAFKCSVKDAARILAEREDVLAAQAESLCTSIEFVTAQTHLVDQSNDDALSPDPEVPKPAAEATDPCRVEILQLAAGTKGRIVNNVFHLSPGGQLNLIGEGSPPGGDFQWRVEPSPEFSIGLLPGASQKAVFIGPTRRSEWGDYSIILSYEVGDTGCSTLLTVKVGR